MAKFNLDRNKGKVSDIKQNIDTKKSELAQLEENKQKLLEAGTDIQGSDIDEDAQRTIMQEINRALEENAEKGQELSDEMNADAKDLEDLKQETQDSMESNKSEREKLEKKQAILDKIGLGRTLDDALTELDDNMTDLNEFQESLIETEKEMDETAKKLSML